MRVRYCFGSNAVSGMISKRPLAHTPLVSVVADLGHEEGIGGFVALRAHHDNEAIRESGLERAAARGGLLTGGHRRGLGAVAAGGVEVPDHLVLRALLAAEPQVRRPGLWSHGDGLAIKRDADVGGRADRGQCRSAEPTPAWSH